MLVASQYISAIRRSTSQINSIIEGFAGPGLRWVLRVESQYDSSEFRFPSTILCRQAPRRDYINLVGGRRESRRTGDSIRSVALLKSLSHPGHHVHRAAVASPPGSFGRPRPSDLGASRDYPNLIVERSGRPRS